MTPTVIVTRPAAQAEAFASALMQRCTGMCNVITAPLIEIEFLPVTQNLDTVTDLILTSANGVAAAARQRLPRVQRAWCVGPKTDALAQKLGIRTIQGPGDANGLVAQILKEKPEGLFAHLRGTHARGDISARLTAAGMDCLDVITYDQTGRALTDAAQSALKDEKPVVFPLFSPRTATILSEQDLFTAPLHCVMMSDAVRQAGLAIEAVSQTIAARPDEDAMLDATVSLVKRLTQGRD